MRSCYPELTSSRKNSSSVHVVEEVDLNKPAEAGRDLATGFEDVELFLAEHGLNMPER